MNKKKISPRRVVLLILFVLIVICSAIAVSYSYYTPPTEGTLSYSTTDITGCLSLTVGNMSASDTPDIFYPTTDADALSQDVMGGTSIGTIDFHVQNLCSEALNYRIIFIPNSSKTLPSNMINYSLCDKEFFNCSNSDFTTVRNLGSAMYNDFSCVTTSTRPTDFWSY